MRLSFGDEEPFKESLGSLNFNNPPTDSDTLQPEGVGSSSMLPEEKNEDPNVILEVRREPVGSSSSPSQERSEDNHDDIL